MHNDRLRPPDYCEILENHERVDDPESCVFVQVLAERLANVIRIQDEQLKVNREIMYKLSKIAAFQNRLIGYSVSVSAIISVLWDYGSKLFTRF